MKYMLNGSFTGNPLMRVTLTASLVFLSAFWVTTAALFFSKMNLTPAAVAAYYRGSEANFTPPRTFGAMLEVTHGHLPVMALVTLLLTHLYIFTRQSERMKIFAIITFFAAAFFGEAAGWLVRFVHPAFAWLKIATFIALEVAMAYIIWGLFQMLLAGNGQTGSPAQPAEVEKGRTGKTVGR